MPPQTQCPECASRLNLSATVRGKKVRCPKCGHVFLFEDEEESPEEGLPAGLPRREKTAVPPRRRYLDDDDDDRLQPRNRPARKEAGSPILMFGLIGASVLLLSGGALTWFLLANKHTETPPAQANNPNPANNNPNNLDPPNNNPQKAIQPVPAGVQPNQGGRNPPPVGRGVDVARNKSVPEVQPAGGDEEFIDLPERGKDNDRIAGLEVNPPVPAGPLKGKVFAPVNGMFTVTMPAGVRMSQVKRVLTLNPGDRKRPTRPTRPGRPGRPVRPIRPNRGNPTGRFTLPVEGSESVMKDGTVFAAASIGIPAVLMRDIPADERFDIFHEVVVKHLDGRVTRESDIMQDPVPGKDYQIQLPRGAARMQLFTIAGWVVYVIVTGPDEARVNGPLAQQYFQSFKLTDNAKKVFQKVGR